MATSTEKVAAAIDQGAAFALKQLPDLQQQASGAQAIALGLAGPYLPKIIGQLAGKLHEGLPTDPGALDRLLALAAEHVLSLQSDPPADADTFAVEVPAAAGAAAAAIPHRVGCSCPDCRADRGELAA